MKTVQTGSHIALVSNASSVPASGASYDPTTSGLTATDVQGAIDEIAAGGLDVYLRSTLGGEGVVQAHGTLGATETIDLALGNLHWGTLDQDCTVSFTGWTNGKDCQITLALIEDGTGGWTPTLTGVTWIGGTPTWDTTLGTITIVALFSWDGGTTTYAGVLGGAGSGSAIEVLDEGSSLTAALASLDFVGAGVTATATGDAVTVTIPGGTGNLPWSYAQADGGLAGDGVTDDTVAFQAWIATVTASGTQSGWFWFEPGTYLIGGALQDTGAFNGQILLPNVSTSDPQITLTFQGPARPPFAYHGVTPAPGGYALIESTLAGASGTAAVISGGNGITNNISVVVRDLLCIAPDNPSFTFWNLSSTQGGKRDGLMIGTSTIWAGTSVTQPSHTNAYGIKLPQTNLSNLSEEDAVMVFGFYTGILHGELVEARYITALCIVGVEVPFCWHPGAHINLVSTSCPYGVRFTGGANYVDIWYDAEHAYVAAGGFVNPAWAVIVYDIDDPSNYWHGHARWQGITPTVGVDNVFNVNGASNAYYEQIGTPPTGALVLREQHAASSSAALNFTTCISSAYDEYLIELVNVIPATNATVLWMQFSTNGGSSYDASAIYDYTAGYAYSGGVGVGGSATNSTKVLIIDAVSNSGNYGVVGSLRLLSPGSTALYKQVIGNAMRSDASGLGLVLISMGGAYKSATAVNAFRFLMDSGNIASGTIRVYGIAK